MSEGRYDGYCRNIGNFVNWIGPQTAIDTIDEAKLEGFFNYLSIQVGAQKYSPNYAHTLMMTAKRCYKGGLIMWFCHPSKMLTSW
jgi:hypothetical protein